MAKDNVPFHSVVFPATLIGSQDESCRWTMVKHLMATEYLNYEDAKFSKSRGIGVFGNDAADTGIPSDVWRFYLMYMRPEAADTAFRWEDLAFKNNSELLANLGNFANRALKFCKDSFGGIVPDIRKGLKPTEDGRLIHQVNKYLASYVDCMEKCKQKEAISYIFNISRLGNQLMQAEMPWKLLKGSDEAGKDRAASVIGLSVNLVALLDVLIEPFMPKLSAELRTQLGVVGAEGLSDDIRKINVLHEDNQDQIQFRLVLPEGHAIGTPGPLITEIKADVVASLKVKFSGNQADRKADQEASSSNPSPPKSTMPMTQKKQNPKGRVVEASSTSDLARKLEEVVSLQREVVRKLKAAPGTPQEHISTADDILLFLKGELKGCKA